MSYNKITWLMEVVYKKSQIDYSNTEISKINSIDTDIYC